MVPHSVGLSRDQRLCLFRLALKQPNEFRCGIISDRLMETMIEQKGSWKRRVHIFITRYTLTFCHAVDQYIWSYIIQRLSCIRCQCDYVGLDQQPGQKQDKTNKGQRSETRTEMDYAMDLHTRGRFEVVVELLHGGAVPYRIGTTFGAFSVG